MIQKYCVQTVLTDQNNAGNKTRTNSNKNTGPAHCQSARHINHGRGRHAATELASRRLHPKGWLTADRCVRSKKTKPNYFLSLERKAVHKTGLKKAEIDHLQGWRTSL